MSAIIKAELRGYVDGQINSVNANIHATHEDISRDLKALLNTVHGRDGDNGLRSDIKRLVWLARVQWAVIALLAARVFDVRIPWVP